MTVPILEFYLNRHFEKVIKKRYGDAVKSIFRDFSSLLVAHLKRGVDIESAVRGYGIGFAYDRRIGRRDSHPYDIPWKTQLGFVVCVNPGPDAIAIAYIGFSRYRNQLIVHQIESIPGAEFFLEPFHWQRLLYSVMIALADRIGYREVHVLPDSFIPDDTVTPSEACEMSSSRALCLYDDGPEQSGFQWNDATNTFTYVIP